MPTTLVDLKDAVAAFLGRNKTDFVVSSKDNLLRAINNAKDFTQRAIKLEYARVFAQVSNVDITNGGNLDNAVLYGTATPVGVRSVERVWLAGTNSTTQFPIAIMSRDEYSRRLQRRMEDIITTTRIEQLSLPSEITPTTPTFVQVGRTFFIFPASTQVLGGQTITVYMDIVQWLADFANDADQSFLLTYAFDYLMLRTIRELSTTYMKEDFRDKFNEKDMEKAWNNVVQWNATIIGNITDDVTLD